VLLFDQWGGYLGKVVSPETQKLASLEGLRGVLAFSVVVHHAYSWFYFTQTGIWSTQNSVIFARLANFGVLQFFYLSGFLFWRKLMKKGRIPMGRFYLSRFVRIGPVYYVCVGTALLIGLSLTGFKLRVPPATLVNSLLPWMLFTVGGRVPVNTADIMRITCGATWTLALEWMFYVSLPFLGWFSRKGRRLLLYALLFGALLLVSKHFRGVQVDEESIQSAAVILNGFARFMLIGFGGGVLVAVLEPRLQDWFRSLSPWQDWLLLGLYLSFLLVPGILPYGQVLLCAGFALVTQGANLFGLLSSRAIRLLGVISYPVYLVHGIVYYTAMRLRGGMHPVNVYAYVGQTVVCFAAVLLLATIIHLVIERPAMKLSEDIARLPSAPRVPVMETPPLQEPASRSQTLLNCIKTLHAGREESRGTRVKKLLPDRG